MAKTTEMVEVALSSLKPYERNAKLHPTEQIERLKESIREFGFISPCLIDNENNIIAGHGRVEAAKSLGLESVPCVYVEGLTDAQRRAYILADNRLTELARWDEELVAIELEELADADFVVELTGFELPEEKVDWFTDRERNDESRQEGNEEYNDFLEKFEVKKTTDDCYTPDNIYEVVADYVERQYGVNRANFVRPFYPGGDYENEEYPEGCVVVDNPPFSILAQIVRFYVERGVKFFLFAPTLTLFSADEPTVCNVCTSNTIRYENGAMVNTGFKTNLENGIAVKTSPVLHNAIEDANRENKHSAAKELPRYEYPKEVITSAMVSTWCVQGVEFSVPRAECLKITALDKQKEKDVGIFGGGYLLSDRQAAKAEKAAKDAKEAVRAKIREKSLLLDGGEVTEDGKIVWVLSEREREIVDELSKGGAQ